MGPWIIYLKERFPLPTYLLLTGGIAVSSSYLAQKGIDTAAVLISLFGLILFFGELRLMDEFKDYSKDLAMHPERPLPRGLLTRDQVSRAIRANISLMGLLGALIWVKGNPIAGVTFLFCTAFLWCMFNDFYTGDFLAKSPATYAVTHQLVIIPLAAFCVFLNNPEIWNNPLVYNWGICLMGGFFTYEVCRKLKPNADPLLGFYLTVYGKARTALFILFTCALGLYGSYAVGLQQLLWPIDILVILSLSLIFLKPSAYKVVEGLSTLMLLLHVWSFGIIQLLSHFGIELHS